MVTLFMQLLSQGYVDSKLNGTWAADNKDWVNSLVRDVANPSEKDEYFAQSRMFDGSTVIHGQLDFMKTVTVRTKKVVVKITILPML